VDRPQRNGVGVERLAVTPGVFYDRSAGLPRGHVTQIGGIAASCHRLKGERPGLLRLRLLPPALEEGGDLPLVGQLHLVARHKDTLL